VCPQDLLSAAVSEAIVERVFSVCGEQEKLADLTPGEENHAAENEAERLGTSQHDSLLKASS